jgi:hypothetical protein
MKGVTDHPKLSQEEKLQMVNKMQELHIEHQKVGDPRKMSPEIRQRWEEVFSKAKEYAKQTDYAASPGGAGNTERPKAPEPKPPNEFSAAHRRMIDNAGK